jgi:hypothetical protein
MINGAFLEMSITQMPFRMKSMPKKSRSFGNPSNQAQNIVANNLLVNGN